MTQCQLQSMSLRTTEKREFIGQDGEQRNHLVFWGFVFLWNSLLGTEIIIFPHGTIVNISIFMIWVVFFEKVWDRGKLSDFKAKGRARDGAYGSWLTQAYLGQSWKHLVSTWRSPKAGYLHLSFCPLISRGVSPDWALLCPGSSLRLKMFSPPDPRSTSGNGDPCDRRQHSLLHGS